MLLSFNLFMEVSLDAGMHRGSILASQPAALGSILDIPKNFSIAVAEIN